MTVVRAVPPREVFYKILDVTEEEILWSIVSFRKLKMPHTWEAASRVLQGSRLLDQSLRSSPGAQWGIEMSSFAQGKGIWKHWV